MVYFIIGAFIVFMVCLCIYLQKQANAEQKDRESHPILLGLFPADRPG